MIKVLLFDMDGTLVNTEELKRKAHERTLRNLGVQELLALDVYAKVMGRPYEEAVAFLREHSGELHASKRDYRHIWDGYYKNLVDEFAAAHEGANALLKLAREERLELAIVSSSTRMEMARVLRKTGLDRWTENWVSADDVSEQKPAPEPYLKALSLTFGNRNTALAVEDTDAGCQSALAASLSVIGVRHELNSQHTFKGARRVLNVLEMANPEQFLSRLLEP